METSKNVFEMKTVQVSPFKVMTASIKDILIDSNIKITKEGIYLVNMDRSLMILVYLFLDAKNFEEYHLSVDKCVIAVNMFHLFKIINTIDTSDTLTMYITEEDYNYGNVKYLSFKFENGDIHQCRTYRLRLIDPVETELEIPADVRYSSIINMPSSDFQKIIRDLSPFSNCLEIKSVGNELIFSANGTFASVQIKRSESEHNMKFTQKDDPVFVNQGFYSLKYLGYVIKCTNLCANCEIYLSNTKPIIIAYNVASLGEIKLCLAPLPSPSAA
jgi:proliferating cell nuclear antigen